MMNSIFKTYQVLTIAALITGSLLPITTIAAQDSPIKSETAVDDEPDCERATILPQQSRFFSGEI